MRLVETLVGNRTAIEPWQKIPDQMTDLGLTAEDGMTKVWFVAADGTLYGGAEAINHCLRLVWWLKPLTYLYAIPGIRQLEDRAYQWIADNRYKLPGSTAACAIDLPKPTIEDSD